MWKRFISCCLIAFLILSHKPISNSLDVKPAKLMAQLFDSIKLVKTLRVHINATERINNGYLTAKSEIKLQSAPRRLYFINRQKKLEILFNQGELNNKALVKPHVFPYITMSLDPTGNIMRKNQHYTIHELGYDFIGKSMALTLAKDKDGINNMTFLGIHPKNGYSCYMLQYENKNYAYTEYVVQGKETASSVSVKLCVNDYLLRDKNDLLNDFGFLKKGKKLLVPTLYCKKAIIYLDQKTCLPVSISLYDDKGLFENYDFTNIETNPQIKPEEFTKAYKDYRF
jgi:hypothetical protein